MRGLCKTRRARAAVVLCGVALVAAGCGEDDFANEPRPPVPVELTGVITPESVTVSPNRVGAGPIVITLSNQTDKPHTVTLQGDGVRERVGPINPEDTATIRQDLPSGRYTVEANSDGSGGIEPAELVIGPKRESASDELLLP